MAARMETYGKSYTPLRRWQEAVLTLKDARHTGAVKVLLEPGR